MYHYCLHTAPTFCDYPFLLPLWQNVIPSLAFANPFLLHSIAALSSIHLAHLCPGSESPAHVQAALHHQDAALKLFRPSINDINAQNASAVFVSTFFVSIFDIASHSPLATPLFSASKRPASPLPLNYFNHLSSKSSTAPCDPSFFAQDSTAFLTGSHNNDNNIISQMQTIFHLLRGVGAVIEVSKDSIRTGPVASLLREVSPDSDKPAAPDVEGALDRLDAFWAAREQVQRDAGVQDGSCVQAIGNLRVAFRNVRTARGRLSSIFKWAVTIDDGFLAALRREDEGALVVLALYGVLLHGLDGFWWTRGWGRALVVAVEGKVETGEARELLSWAWRKVQCDSS
jgi:Fungal specific transcription factor domain